jgi:hypothetical protein
MAFPKPSSGDIVQCRFPEARLPKPGPKSRPGLILDVEVFDDGNVDVVVAYGTSQDVGSRYPGEFTVAATESGAGLNLDTKFDLRRAVKLPYTEEWFEPAPGRTSGPSPRRGKLDLRKPAVKKALQTAVTEARAAGAFDVLDLGSRATGGSATRRK